MSYLLLQALLLLGFPGVLTQQGGVLNYSLLHLAALYNCGPYETHEGHQKYIIQSLIKRKAAIDDVVDGLTNTTPLAVAAERGAEQAVAQLIVLKAAIEVQDLGGRTPLMLAAAGGHAVVVQLLLRAKANFQYQDSDGATALALAAGVGSRATCEALVQSKASVNLAKKNGGTPLMLAAQKGHLECVRLLIMNGARKDDSLVSSRATALFLAAQNGHLQVAGCLMANHAAHAIGVLHGNQMSPLAVAIRFGQVNTVKMMIQRKAPYDQTASATYVWDELKQEKPQCYLKMHQLFSQKKPQQKAKPVKANNS